MDALLRRKLDDWRSRQEARYAVDLIGASIALGDFSCGIEAAESLRRNAIGMSPWIRELIEEITGPKATSSESDEEPMVAVMRMRIQKQRRRLRSEAADPIGWVEMARLYANVGSGQKAENAMEVALHLAGDNRFVLRCASRLFSHLENPDKAKGVLESKRRTREDPWLMAARVAVGSVLKETSAVRRAERMLKDGRFGLVHISELAAGVATIELESGNMKRARKHFEMALRMPTENSVAQALWASRKWGLQVRMPEIKVLRQFEADAWRSYINGEWRKCVKNTNSWQSDEPFSSRPGALGSFTAAVCLGDYEAGDRIAKQGVIANPSDFTLRNNSAYCLIHLGRMDEAEQTLRRMKMVKTGDVDEMVYMATDGLYQYRSGRARDGKALYLRALERADRLGYARLGALMAAQYAMEEAASKSAAANAVQKEASRRLLAAHREVPEEVFLLLERRIRSRVVMGREGGSVT